MALEKSAPTRSTPTATRSTSSPQSAKTDSTARTQTASPSPSADTSAPRESGTRSESAVLEPQDSVSLSSGQDDFDPNAMRNLDRTLRASQSESASQPETSTDSILGPRGEDFEERMGAYAEEQTAAAKARLEAGDYASEATRQSDLEVAGRSVEDFIEARNYVESVGPEPLENYVPDGFTGTQKERTQAALRARREEGIELMDEVLADPNLTIEERNAALLSVQKHFEYNSLSSRQRDPVTLQTIHQGGFPEAIYGSDNDVAGRTTSIINHDPSKGLSPYSVTFDSINGALNPESHFSSFLKNPSRLGDIAWSELDVRDAVGSMWQSLIN